MEQLRQKLQRLTGRSETSGPGPGGRSTASAAGAGVDTAASSTASGAARPVAPATTVPAARTRCPTLEDRLRSAARAAGVRSLEGRVEDAQRSGDWAADMRAAAREIHHQESIVHYHALLQKAGAPSEAWRGLCDGLLHHGAHPEWGRRSVRHFFEHEILGKTTTPPNATEGILSALLAPSSADSAWLRSSWDYPFCKVARDIIHGTEGSRPARQDGEERATRARYRDHLLDTAFALTWKRATTSRDPDAAPASTSPASRADQPERLEFALREAWAYHQHQYAGRAAMLAATLRFASAPLEHSEALERILNASANFAFTYSLNEQTSPTEFLRQMLCDPTAGLPGGPDSRVVRALLARFDDEAEPRGTLARHLLTLFETGYACGASDQADQAIDALVQRLSIAELWDAPKVCKPRARQRLLTEMEARPISTHQALTQARDGVQSHAIHANAKLPRAQGSEGDVARAKVLIDKLASADGSCKERLANLHELLSLTAGSVESHGAIGRKPVPPAPSAATRSASGFDTKYGPPQATDFMPKPRDTESPPHDPERESADPVLRFHPLRSAPQGLAAVPDAASPPKQVRPPPPDTPS